MRSHLRRPLFLSIFGVIFIFYLINYEFNDENQFGSIKNSFSSRQLLSIKPNCSPRAIDNFPHDLFSQKSLRNGVLVIHFLIVVYMFVGLAIICEDYFVPCLECICERLNLQPDVAGATFMAAGSSAPELATTVIGVFIAKDDIALGAVVGSADYNLMFVIGLCALFAKVKIHLNWWPLFRDCSFYSISIILLAFVIYDSLVFWYEAIFFLIFYGIYIVINYYNKTLEVSAKALVAKYLPNCTLNSQELSDEAYLINNDNVEDVPEMRSNIEMVDANCHIDNPDQEASDISFTKQSSDSQCISGCFSAIQLPDKKTARWWNYLYYVTCFPLRILLCISVPDCRIQYFKRFFWITFFNSCLWIAIYSYFMIWMITIIGDTLNIPDSIMGLTFVAAGSSVPDAIASVLVVLEGQGDMAVSNAVGSNVFDILICMGLPWLIRCIIYGAPVIVYSKGLLYATMTLFITVFALLFITHLYRWTMTKIYGSILLIIYLAFLILCSMYELNIFGDVHPPQCR